GGCPWMHVARDAQLAAKHQIAAGALRKAIARGMELSPPLAPVPPLGWRRRAHLRWDGGRLGFVRRRSHALADARACPQLDPPLERALGVAGAALDRRGRGDLYLLLGHRGDVHVVAGEVRAIVQDGALVPMERIELEPGLAVAADEFAQASEPGNDALVAE